VSRLSSGFFRVTHCPDVSSSWLVFITIDIAIDPSPPPTHHCLLVPIPAPHLPSSCRHFVLSSRVLSIPLSTADPPSSVERQSPRPETPRRSNLAEPDTGEGGEHPGCSASITFDEAGFGFCLGLLLHVEMDFSCICIAPALA
jgi:hypothetical protein